MKPTLLTSLLKSPRDLAPHLGQSTASVTCEKGSNGEPLWIPLVSVITQPLGNPSIWGLITHITKKAQALGPAWTGGVESMSLMNISCCPWADSLLRGRHLRKYGCQWLFTGQGWDTAQVSQCTALHTTDHDMSPVHTSQRQSSKLQQK